MQVTKLRELIVAYDNAKGPIRKAFKTHATCIENVKKLLATVAHLSGDSNISDRDIINCFLGPKNRPEEGSESQGTFHMIVAAIFPGKDASAVIREHFSPRSEPIEQNRFDGYRNRIMRVEPPRAAAPAAVTTVTTSVPDDTHTTEIERLRAELASKNDTLTLLAAENHRLQLAQQQTTVIPAVDLEPKVSQLEANNAELLRVITEQKATLSSQEQLTRAKTEEVQKITAHLTAVQSALFEKESAEAALMAQIEKIEKATQVIEEMAVESASTKALLAEKEIPLSEMTTAKDQLMQELEKKEKQLSEKQAHADQLSDALAMLRAEHQASIETQTAAFEELTESAKTTAAELVSTKELLVAQENLVAQLTASNEKLQADLTEKESDITIKTEQLAQMAQSASERETVITTQHAEMEKLATSSREMTTELEIARASLLEKDLALSQLAIAREHVAQDLKQKEESLQQVSTSTILQENEALKLEADALREVNTKLMQKLQTTVAAPDEAINDVIAVLQGRIRELTEQLNTVSAAESSRPTASVIRSAAAATPWQQKVQDIEAGLQSLKEAASHSGFGGDDTAGLIKLVSQLSKKVTKIVDYTQKLSAAFKGCVFDDANAKELRDLFRQGLKPKDLTLDEHGLIATSIGDLKQALKVVEAETSSQTSGTKKKSGSWRLGARKVDVTTKTANGDRFIEKSHEYSDIVKVMAGLVDTLKITGVSIDSASVMNTIETLLLDLNELEAAVASIPPMVSASASTTDVPPPPPLPMPEEARVVVAGFAPPPPPPPLPPAVPARSHVGVASTAQGEHGAGRPVKKDEIRVPDAARDALLSDIQTGKKLKATGLSLTEEKTKKEVPPKVFTGIFAELNATLKARHKVVQGNDGSDIGSDSWSDSDEASSPSSVKQDKTSEQQSQVNTQTIFPPAPAVPKEAEAASSSTPSKKRGPPPLPKPRTPGGSNTSSDA